jgi:signal transduction histidine kinase
MLHATDELQRVVEHWSQQLGRPVVPQEALGLALNLPNIENSRWTLVRKGGEHFTASLRVNRLQTPESDGVAFVAIAVDLSEQVRAEEALKALNTELEARVASRTAELSQTLGTLGQAQDELLRADKLAALGSLVAGVSHELNTPLGTSLTAASTLHERSRELLRDIQNQSLRRSTLEAYARDSEQMCELLLRSLHNAGELVQHFKQLSVDQTGEQRRSYQLDTVVSDVLTVLRPQLKHSALRVETDLALPQAIDGFPGEMGRLLTNLVQNAQLHGFEPGQAGVIKIAARALGTDRFELSFSDNGNGMTSDVKRRAFDPFFTTKLGKGGSGLGLNIVYNIAAGLGGHVELFSEPGQGSRFVFELPLRAPARGANSLAALQTTKR